MKKICILVMLLTGLVNMASAQVLQPAKTPGSQPVKNPLPNPTPHLLQPADLQVTALSFVSADWLTTSKTVLLKVNITIQNAGQTKAVASKMVGFFQNGNGTGDWKQFTTTLDVPAINPGQSLSAVYAFKESVSALGVSKRLNIYVEADASRVVNEISETNNASPHILIAL